MCRYNNFLFFFFVKNIFCNTLYIFYFAFISFTAANLFSHNKEPVYWKTYKKALGFVKTKELLHGYATKKNKAHIPNISGVA